MSQKLKCQLKKDLQTLFLRLSSLPNVFKCSLDNRILLNFE